MRRLGMVLVAGFSLVSDVVQPRAQNAFPYEHELMLDARPMKGSKRLPSLEIAADGTATITLWCDTVAGQFVIVGDTLTILTGAKTEQSCTADRAAGDDALLTALNQVTNWRLQGDVLVLGGGAQPVRFRIATN